MHGRPQSTLCPLCSLSLSPAPLPSINIFSCSCRAGATIASMAARRGLGSSEQKRSVSDDEDDTEVIWRADQSDDGSSDDSFRSASRPHSTHTHRHTHKRKTKRKKNSQQQPYFPSLLPSDMAPNDGPRLYSLLGSGASAQPGPSPTRAGDGSTTSLTDGGDILGVGLPASSSLLSGPL